MRNITTARDPWHARRAWRTLTGSPEFVRPCAEPLCVKGEECKDHGEKWARVWSDGECEPHYADTQSSAVTTLKNLNLVQQLKPDQKVIRLRGDTPTPAEVAYENVGDAPFEMAYEVSGRQRLQYKFRTAIEYERQVGWLNKPDRVFLDERLFVDNMFTSHRFDGGHAEVDNFPAPSRINYGPGCTQPWLYKNS